MYRIHQLASLLFSGSSPAARNRTKSRRTRASRHIKVRSLETLEPRNMMSAIPWHQTAIDLVGPMQFEPPAAVATIEGGTSSNLRLSVAAKMTTALATPRDGTPDESFSKDGEAQTNFSGTDFAKSVAVDTKGRTIVVGNGGDDFGVVRYLANGKLDKNFGKGGKVRINFGGVDTAKDVIVLSDGRILVVGAANNEADFGMAMLKEDGSLDRSFGNGGKVLTNFAGTDYAEAVAVDSAGRIIVVGNGGDDFGIARYLSNGKLDTAFGPSDKYTAPGKVRINFGGVDAAKDVRILRDGRILVVGAANNQQDFGMLVLKENGTLDTSFGSGGKVLTNFSGTDYAEAVAVDNKDRIIVVGNGGDDFGIVRYLPNGMLDTTFGPSDKYTAPGKVRVNFGGVDVAKDVIALPDGRILIVGAANNQRDSAMIMLTEQGQLDPTFGVGGKVVTRGSGTNTAEGVALDHQGRIVVVGRRGGDFGVARFNLAPRWLL